MIPERDRGFVMVALLVGMAIAAIWLSAALPSWRQQAQRQREEDLIFRGEQYARALVLYYEKNNSTYPPDFDALVSGHFLRKKWKDPVTGEDFIPVGIGVIAPPRQGGPGQPSTAGQPIAPAAPITGNQQPGISGVRSASNATSIKVYEGQQMHSSWPFDAARLRLRMGRTTQQGPGRGGQDGRGGPGRGGDQGAGPGRGGDAAGPGRGAPGRGGELPPVGGRRGGGL
jgi:type II secretory pathway pseudopilin PulG